MCQFVALPEQKFAYLRHILRQCDFFKRNALVKLASVKKGSKEEYDLKISQLKKLQEAEIKAAQKTGADITIIEAKYLAKRRELDESFANERIKRLQIEYATQQLMSDKQYQDKMNKLSLNYAEELKLAQGNADKIAEIEAKYEKESSELSQTYAIQTAQTQINMFKKQLNEANLSEEERRRIEEELARAEMALSDLKTEHIIENTKREADADDKLKKKRLANMQKWLDVASEAISAINDLVSAIYDAQLEKIEEQQEANEEQSEKEIERIETLVENNVITEEEGEARKRATEAKTAQKNEELEKKKQAIEYKQAVWQKATDLAQAGISTALGIMQTIANVGFPLAIPMIATISALGAIQMATIAATPIPKYAKGTGENGHPGGLAIVGDGGRQEAVLFGDKIWITPDKPTLVDIPQGATVYPDINDFETLATENDMYTNFASIIPFENTKVVVNNDFSKIIKEFKAIFELIRKQTKQQHTDANKALYEVYKNSKM